MKRRLVGLSFLVATAAAACSASNASTSSDGGAQDAAVALQPGSPCPVAVPTVHAPCSSAAACEYGGDAHGACRTLATCDPAVGTWTVVAPADGCAAPVNPAACPATFATLHATAPCPDASGRLSCDYAEGRCQCLGCQSASGASSEWACRAWDSVPAVGPYSPDASASCPTELPELGAPCAYPDQTICQYEVRCAGVSLGHSLVCADGHWQQDFLTPPGNCGGLTCG